MNLVIFLSFFLLVGLSYVWERYKQKRLHKSFGVTTGFINDLKQKRRGHNGSFEIKFSVGVGNYSDFVGIPCRAKDLGDMAILLLKRRLPRVYEKGNPGNCELLYSWKQYKEYNLTPGKEYIWIIDSVQRILERND